MDQIEKLVERFNTQYAYLRDDEVKRIVKTVNSYIEACENLSIENKIKVLSYLYNKCEYIVSSIASTMNYQLEYEPTDDEVWTFAEKHCNINEVDPESFDAGTLYERVIYPMAEIYEEKNKDASGWCNKILDVKDDIHRRLSKEKDKQLFLQEALKSNEPLVPTTIDECLINCDKGVLKAKLSPLLQGKKGNEIATVISALQELGYTISNQTVLFEIFKKEFGASGHYNSVTNGMRIITQGDDRKAIDKKEAMKKELKQ